MADKSEDLPGAVLSRGKTGNGPAPPLTVMGLELRFIPLRLLPRAIGPSACCAGAWSRCSRGTPARQGWSWPQGHTRAAGCPSHNIYGEESYCYGDNQTENVEHNETSVLGFPGTQCPTHGWPTTAFAGKAYFFVKRHFLKF
jgi:hypothetical protein